MEDFQWHTKYETQVRYCL